MILDANEVPKESISGSMVIHPVKTAPARFGSTAEAGQENGASRLLPQVVIQAAFVPAQSRVRYFVQYSALEDSSGGEMEPVMEGEQVSTISLKRLVKRIVAAVCFPSVLKLSIQNDNELDGKAMGTRRPQNSTKSVRLTTVLNSWRARFSSILSQGSKVNEGKEVKILSQDSHDGQLKTQGEEVLSKKSLQEACQDHKVQTDELVEVSSTLPEDLVERILAMVPFPYLFKARMLSKSWLARFSPISFQDDEVKQQLAISFQKKVGEWSTNWKTFCPIILDRWKGNFLAYDRTSQRFQRLPSLSFLPKTLLEGHPIEAHDEIDGAIFLLSWFPHLRGAPLRSHSSASWKHILYVANFLTRSWKELPSCPVAGVLDPEGFKLHFHCRFKKLVSQTLLGTYKVIVFYTAEIIDECSYFLAQIYDSKSNAWRSKSFVKNGHTFYCRPARRPVYLNGVVYMILHNNTTGLLTFNVQEETFEELELVGYIMGRGVYGLVVCNNNLLMILAESNDMQVLKIDLTLLTLLEVARGPPADLNVVVESIANVCHNSDGDRLCFPTKGRKGMVVYNVREDEWSYFSFPRNLTDVTSISYHKSLTFQPNLNTFLVV